MFKVLKTLVRYSWRLLTVLRRLLAFMMRGSTILIIVLMLLVNAATLTVTSLNTLFSAAIVTVTGVASVSTTLKKSLFATEAKAAQVVTELKDTKSKLAIEQRKSDILAKKYGTAHVENGKLQVENGKLHVENGKLRTHGPDVTFRGKKRPMKTVAKEVATNVSKRTAKVAAANVSSIAAEGIPFWGIAVNVAATTLEIAAACDTMKDMSDFVSAFDETSAPDEGVDEVCGMRVPTADEVWEAVKSSPGKVWDSVSELLPDRLPTPDFSGWWPSFVASVK